MRLFRFIRIFIFLTTLIILSSFFAPKSHAQATGDYRSAATGTWATLSTWQRFDGSVWATPTAGQGTPTSASGVITIRSPHVVTVGATITVDQVTIESGATVTINTNIILTIANGTGTDLTVNSGGTIIQNGTNSQATISASAAASISGTWRNNNTNTTNGGITITGTLTFENGGVYEHNTNQGTIPLATWSDGSTMKYTATSTNTTAPTNLAQTGYAHFEWADAANNAKTFGGNVTTTGNFTITSGSLTFGTTAARTITIGGNYTMNSAGTNAWSTTGGTTMNLTGNFIQSAGTITLASGNGGVSTINITGNFSKSGGTLNLTGGGNVNTRGNINVSGNFTNSSGSMAVSNGQSNITFEGTTIQTYTSGGTLSGAINHTVTTDAILHFATESSTITSGSSGTFSLNSGATLGITSANGITSSGASGNIQSTGSRTFNVGANYIYNRQDGAQDVGNGYPTNLTGTLTINNNGNTVTLDNSRTIANGGNVNLTNGTFATGTNLTMASTSTITRNAGSMTGTLQGSGTYNVVYTGSSKTTNGEITGAGINNITVNVTAGQTITLHQNETIAGDLTITQGIFTTSGSDYSFSAVNIDIAGSNSTLTANGSSITVSGGSLTLGSGSTFTAGSSTVTMNDGSSISNSSTLAFSGLTIPSSATVSVSIGTFTVGGTFTANSGSTVNFNSTSNITVPGLSYVNLGVGITSNSTATTYTLGGNTTISGVLTVGNASSTAVDTLAGSTRTINFTGSGTPFVITASWGNFQEDTSTVQYSNNGGATTITPETYYNLSVTTTSARTATFTSGATYAVADNGSLTFTGAASNLLTLAPSGGTSWNLQVSTSGTTVSVSYVSVSRSNASGYKQIDASDGTNTNGGNNDNWLFVLEIPNVNSSHWKLDEGFGTTTADSTVNSNTATLSGSPTWQSEEMCVAGKCLYFNGTSSYLSVQKSVDIKTVAMWVKPMNVASIALADFGNSKTITTNSSGVISANGFSSPTIYLNGTSCTNCTLTANVWQHVAVTTGTTISGGTITIAKSSSTFVKGFLDEVRLYDTEYSNTQVQALFSARGSEDGVATQFGPDLKWMSDGLLGYWKMDDQSGNATDSSGNGRTLSNNGTTTYSSGKYGNASEHVPASNQYFSYSSDTSEDTYYFDASDAGPTEGLAWTNGSNAFNGNITDYAESQVSGNPSNNILFGGGTNAPASGNPINSVDARIYGIGSCDGSVVPLNAYIESSDSEHLGTPVVSSFISADWGNYTTLSAPSGGWTWDKVQALQVKIYGEGHGSCGIGSDFFRAYRIEVLVDSGGVGTLNDTRTVSFWTNPDSTTNYYASLTSEAYITSTSGILTATGFTNPKIYVNGVESRTIVADEWQHITVTSETAIDADQFYIGRQGSNYFDGEIDEMRVYNRVLSPSEITQLYNFATHPTAYWKMDESAWIQNCSTDTVFDSSTNGYNGDSCPSTTGPTTSTGKIGNAGQFDGSDDRVVIPSTFAIPSLQGTVSAWVYPTTGTYDIFAGGTNNNDFRLSPQNNVYGFFIGSDYRVSYSSDPPLNTWTYVTLSWDQTLGSQLYYNGELVATNSTPPPAFNQTGAIIGSRPDGGGDYMNGKIDDVKVYNYARTGGQIIEDMNAGHPIGGSPIGSQTAYYKFDEQQGTTANNSITNTLSGSISGAVWKVSGSSLCKINGCLDFDGTDDEISISNANAIDLNNGLTNGFSITAWVYADSDGEGDVGRIFDKGSNTYLRVSGESGGKVNLQASLDLTGGGDATLTVTSAMDIGTWNHVSLTWTNDSDDEISVYVNGVLRGTSTNGNGNPAAESNALIIGGDSGTGGNFDGRIDEFKVYSAELTRDQILLDMNANAATSWGGVMGTQNNEGSGGNPPIAYLKFDENTGTTAADNSGNGLSGSINGPQWSTGKVGTALSFDGTDDYVSISDNNLLDFGTSTDFTYSFWTKLNNNSLHTLFHDGQEQNGVTDASIYAVYNDTVDAVEVILTSDTWNVYCILRGLTDIADNQWHHLSFVVNRSSSCTTTNVLIYIDGKKEPTTVTLSGINTNANLNNDDPLTIGAYYKLGAYNSHLNGYMDEFKVYNYARTQNQIAWDYNRGAPLAHYKFDECSGSTAYNSAPAASGGMAGNNATINIVGSGTYTSPGDCNSGTSTHAWNAGTIGKVNSALGFDGTNDYVVTSSNFTNFTGASPATLSAWVNINSVSNQYPQIIKQTSSTNGEFEIGISIDQSVNKFQFQICKHNVSCHTIFSRHTLSTATWYHVLGTFDGTTINFYINGVLQGTETYSLGAASDGTDFLFIGSDNTGATSNRFFNGLIDEAKVFNYALVESQIKQIYNNGAIFFGPATGSP